MTPPWTLRVLPHFPSRRLLPEKLARLRVFDGAVVDPRPRAGHRVRRAARVRDRRRRALDRLAGQRPRARRGGAHLAARSATGGCSACSTPAAPRPPGSATSRGWTPRSTPPCCWRCSPPGPSDRVDLLAVDTAVRARVEGGHRTKLTRLINAMAAAGAGPGRDRLRPGRRRGAAPRPQAGPGGDLHRAGRRRRSSRACCRCCPGWPPGTAWWWPRPRPGDRPRWPAPAGRRDRRRRARGRGRRAGPGRARPGPGGADALGVIVVDEPRELFASRVADAYLALKAAGRL